MPSNFYNRREKQQMKAALSRRIFCCVGCKTYLSIIATLKFYLSWRGVDSVGDVVVRGMLGWHAASRGIIGELDLWSFHRMAAISFRAVGIKQFVCGILQQGRRYVVLIDIRLK
jgi:hypothetical protein